MEAATKQPESRICQQEQGAVKLKNNESVRHGKNASLTFFFIKGTKTPSNTKNIL